MKLEGRFSYTGSSAYDLSNIEVSPNGLALFDAVTGVGGIDYMPYDGATVFIASGIVNTSGVKNFLPSLNNKAYYLVTNTLYTEADKDTIISLATSITMALSGSRYTGSFVFSNPSNYEYLYLIWDNVDRIEGGSASYSGDADTKHLDIDFGTNIGVAGVTHTLTGTPSRFILKYNGSVVGDTGYIGLNSTTNYNDLIAAGVDAADIKLTLPLDGLVDNGTGDLLFSKNTSEGSAILSVYSPLAGNTWSLTQIDPSLTSFYLDTDNGTLSNVCSQIANTQMYHDGVNALPVNGDRIYRDSAGANAFDGANSYHLISTTSMGAPPVSGGVFLAIDADGVAYAYGECDCSEVAIPVIDQDDLSFVMGEQVDITISATNNPTSWEVVSSCDKYILTGGDKGSIFSVTDCNGVIKNVTVNINQSTTVCATAAAISFGTGTATLNGACVDSVFPRGLSFDTNTGRLYGIPEDTCSYSVELIATNCFGDSINTTIVIDVASTPAAIKSL